MGKGLSAEEAKRRLKEYGANEIESKKRLIWLKILISQIKSPLVYILFFAVIVTVWLGDYVDAGVIMVVVLMNTLLGFIQEYRAERSLVALRRVLAPKAKILRNGEWVLLPAAMVVPGDIVFLSDEHKVPADGVLVEEDGLFTVEAILTGESEPVEKFDYAGDVKGSEAEVVDHFDKIEARYKAFMGTEVRTGVAKMLVVRTGKNTEVGKIAHLLKEAKDQETPLQGRVRKLSRQLALLVFGISVLVLTSGLIVGREFEEIFTTAVALAVSAIPEGLAVSLTVILAIAMQRILTKRAVVRRLAAAETLGSVDVICVDKTGTLTHGTMKVTEGITNLGTKRNQAETDLMRAAILCNDLRDPLELAMDEWAREKLKEGEELKERYERIDSLPFNPRDKYIATLHLPVAGRQELFVSGAPEVVLSRTDLSTKEKKLWQEKFREMGSQGYRLVGFGEKIIKGKKKLSRQEVEDLKWLGIVVYEDPVRKEVAGVVKQVTESGIKVKVVTGDYRETAVAIMKQIGLIDGVTDEMILEGDELEKMSDQELREVIDSVVLFARTNPEQKLKIVEALKAKGHVVAMTGDGVNDAPALKRADIGLVVNEASEVSKETADMVLLDSNFETIVHAIEEGRAVYDNFKRIIVYLLADAFAEVLVVVVSLLLGWPLPLIAVQILWINLLSDGLPNLALTVEPEEEGLLQRPPRLSNDGLIDRVVITLVFLISVGAAIMTLLAFRFYWNGTLYSLELARTVAFAMLGVNSLFYVFSSRSLEQPIWKVNFFRNPLLLLAVGIGFMLQGLVIYWPILQGIFRTVPIGLPEWSLVISASMVLIVVVEGVKFAYKIRE